MPKDNGPEEDDETETEACEQLTNEINEVVETIDKAVGELEAIDQNDLRRRFTKRIDKAISKLAVAKKELEQIVTLAEHS